MPERYRVTPRHKGLRGHHDYGYHWPTEGRDVTAAEIGVDTLQRLDGDSRYDVVRLDPPAAGATEAEPEAPKPPSRRRKI